jgi:hypothetical protein
MNSLRRVLLWVAPFFALLPAVPAAHAGPGIVDEQVDGNVLEARIVIAGLELADLRIEFEDVTGLEPGALGLSARLLNPLELLLVLTRLPDAVLTTIPLELPLLITANPGPGFEMRGVAQVSLHTELLPYALGTPLRLFGAPINGAFDDVTAWTDAGSYRAGGPRPVLMQQYVVGADLRQDETVAESKLDVLDLILAQRAGVIDPTVLGDLTARAAAVRGTFEGGDHDGAIAELDDFAAAVVAESGEGIPDIWRRTGNAANAAGELRSQAATLRYTLVRLDQGL